jgi:hypothetical protein
VVSLFGSRPLRQDSDLGQGADPRRWASAKHLLRNGKVRGRDSGPAKPIVRLTPPLGRGSSIGSPDYLAGEN